MADPAAQPTGDTGTSRSTGTIGDTAIATSQRRTDRIAEVVVRHVAAEMAGRPAGQVYRALNARLHAADAPLDSEQVREYAESISAGTWAPRRS